MAEAESEARVMIRKIIEIVAIMWLFGACASGTGSNGGLHSQCCAAMHA